MCKGNFCGGKGCMCVMGWIMKILLIVGGLNWGLVGISTLMGNGDAWNVVHMLLGSLGPVEAIVYVLVGLTALMSLFGGCKCHKCAGGVCEAEPTQKV